jgi:hypothetical protein
MSKRMLKFCRPKYKNTFKPNLLFIDSLCRYFKTGYGEKLSLVWRNKKKISQIINDYLYLPFFLLFILNFWSHFVTL